MRESLRGRGRNAKSVENGGQKEARLTGRESSRGRGSLWDSRTVKRHLSKFGIWFPSSSVFVCSTYTAMGEEIMSVVCASSAAHGHHVDDNPTGGHTGVMVRNK